MTQRQADDQFLAITSFAFAAGDGGGKNVRRVGWVLFPVNVVVIHAADHQRIGQRGRYWIDALASPDHGCVAASGDLIQYFECELYIVLLIAAEGAAD